MNSGHRPPLLNRLPLTRLRVLGARAAYRLLRTFYRSDFRRIARHGVTYDVDLSEGIDLSLFLFGNFQSHVAGAEHFTLPPDAVVIDVGANFGAMTLDYARRVPTGFVYAFEPTEYAFRKLQKNLSLNPDLASRVRQVHAFVSNQPSDAEPVTAYSSWKVDGKNPDIHPVHCGLNRPPETTRVVTLDQFCRDNSVDRVDLIKIDTDGHELEVLQGGRETIDKNMPIVIFEIGDYLLRERGQCFDDFFKFFQSLGYTLRNTRGGREVTPLSYSREVPLRATTDLIAIRTNRARSEGS